MLNRKYYRNFILLNGKNEGIYYNLNGSCDIEVINGRAKLYSFVSGMGKLKNKPRELLLMAEKDGKNFTVSAGKYELKGINASLDTTFDPNNIFDSGLCLEDIKTVAVCGYDDNFDKAILEGFMCEDKKFTKNSNIHDTYITKDSINKESVNKEPIKKESIKKESINKELVNKDSSNKEHFNKEFIEKEPIKEDINCKKPVLQAAEAANECFSPHDTFKVIAEKFKKELDMLDELGIVDKSIILGENKKDTGNILNKDIGNNKMEQQQEQQQEQEQQIGAIDKLFLDNEKIKNRGNIEWIKSDIREAYLMPVDLNIIRSLFVKNYARKGNHIILGRNKENYYIGIPGSKDIRSIANSNGFYEFFTLENMGSAGYWIRQI